MSNGAKCLPSELGKGFFVRFSRPFRERGKRIIRFRQGFVEQHALLGQPITQCIARLDAKPGAHRARQHGLAFHRNLREGRGFGSRAGHWLNITYCLTSYRAPNAEGVSDQHLQMRGGAGSGGRGIRSVGDAEKRPVVQVALVPARLAARRSPLTASTPHPQSEGDGRMPGPQRWRVAVRAMGLNVTNGRPPETVRSKPKKHRARDALGLAELRLARRSTQERRRKSDFDKPRFREASRPVGPLGPNASRAPARLLGSG